MKKIISLLLTFSLVFTLSACGNDSTANETDKKNDSNVSSSTKTDKEAEKDSSTVEIKIPAELVSEDDTQENLDSAAKEKEWKSAKLNEDGSITYVMTKKQHKKFMEETFTNSKKKLIALLDLKNFLTSLKSKIMIILQNSKLQQKVKNLI